MNNKMRTKNLLVSFLVLAAIFVVASSVSAYTVDQLDIDGSTVAENLAHGDDFTSTVALSAGDTIEVEVWYTAEAYDEDVEVEVELEDVRVSTESANVVFDGDRVKETLNVRVPYDLEDDLYDELDFQLTIEGDDEKTVVEGTLTAKRSSYNVAIKSISTTNTAIAGETVNVDFVLRNMGFHDLDDLYVTVQIADLGVKASGYFGDVVALECDDDEDYNINDSNFDRKCDDDDEDSVNGRLSLKVPYDALSGVYDLELSVENEDTTATKVTQIAIDNDFESNVFKSGNNLWIVNPTDNVMGYRIVAESSASVSESVVFLGAGESKSIAVEPNAQGEYSFDVNVFTMSGDLYATATFSGNTGATTDSTTETNPVVILTVVLAIIFIVLLIVLIVLIGKKPKESGEFGESYY